MISTAYHQHFLILGAFSPAAGAPASGENRAFRGYALSRSGHAAPTGRRVLLRNPYNRLRANQSAESAAFSALILPADSVKDIRFVNLEMFFIFETGIAGWRAGRSLQPRMPSALFLLKAKEETRWRVCYRVADLKPAGGLAGADAKRPFLAEGKAGKRLAGLGGWRNTA
jgi:hypothetical protein